MNWDLYQRRLTINGETQRDRQLTDLKNNILKSQNLNLSYKDVLINDMQAKLVIDSGTKPQFKIIKSLPNEIFYLGDMITWVDSKWLVVEADSDDEVYVDGKLQECNYQLRWQNNNGDIVEYWIVSQNATAYNNGENGNKTITLGSDQLMLFVPYDNETIKLRRGRRFFIDNNKVNPVAYKLTRVDTTSYIKNGHGYICIIVTEDVEKKVDRVDLMLCDYIEIDKPDDIDIWTMNIDYKTNYLYIGGNYKTITATLEDTMGLEVPNTDYVWTVSSGIANYITTNVNGKELKIKAINDINIIGESIKITVASRYTGQVAECILLVKG